VSTLNRKGGGDNLIELLKGWITNITIAIFFITAVEMILPDNSITRTNVNCGNYKPYNEGF